MKSVFRVAVGALLLTACAEEPTGQQAAPDPASDEPMYSEDALIIDFGAANERGWYATNDTVMGGVSDGEVRYTDEEMVFEGFVSTDNNGGFTSVRSPDEEFNLKQYDRVIVRMRSEGQPFTLIMAHNPNWWQDQFRYDIEIDSDDWELVEIPFEDFELHSLSTGYPSPTGDMMRPRDRREILHVEFMSKLFEDGPFRLEVDFVAFD